MIIESEPPTPEQVALAEMLIGAMRELDEVNERIAHLKEMIANELPNGTIVNMGDVYVVRGERRPHRKLNVVGLLKRNLPREAFSTIKPSVTVFTEYAERNNWPEVERDSFIIPGGDPVPTVSVRSARPAEEDQTNEEN